MEIKRLRTLATETFKTLDSLNPELNPEFRKHF